MFTRRIATVTAVSLAAALALTGCSSAATGSASSGSASPSATAGAKVSHAKASSTKPSAPKVSADWYASNFGTFAAVKQTGSGAAVIPLPAGTKAGVITATYQGSDNFIVQGLDGSNQPTIDGAINAIGNYSGVTAFGLAGGGLGKTTKSFQVTASGPWTISIAPIDSAAPMPASGHGDGVYKYDGAAKTWTFTNTGQSNFIVTQYSKSSPMPSINVNEIGNYSGSVPGVSGPSVIVVQSDGAWTAK